MKTDKTTGSQPASDQQEIIQQLILENLRQTEENRQQNQEIQNLKE